MYSDIDPTTTTRMTRQLLRHHHLLVFTVRFLSELDFHDMVLLGTRMQHQQNFPPVFDDEGATALAGVVMMKQGDRGNAMWIV